MASIEKLLAELARGTLTAELAAAELEQIARTYPVHRAVLTTRVQSEIAADRISHAAGRLLLAAIDRGVRQGDSMSSPERTAVLGDRTQVDDRTQAQSDRTQVDEDATTLRPTAVSGQPTALPPVDSTVRIGTPSRPASTIAAAASIANDRDTGDETQLRPASTDTVAMQSASATQRMNPTALDATLQLPPASTQVHDPDATLATPRFSPTAARTLQAPLATEVLSQSTADVGHDKTHVITERLVQSLDEIEGGPQGPLQPGSIIKRRFVLDTLIGKGGMGLVFSAIDRRKEEAQDPNPRVALKVLNADFERHPQSFIALQREARKAQTLAHPNVVTVFDFDRDGDTVYMTMELLKGKPLEAIAREARGKGIDRDTALPIIRGIAEGLAYAHRKGIVHSDLKPGNVFILEDGTPKILDFGIARAVPNSNPEENKDVFDAGSLGAYTEAYATDEMVDGIDPHPADDMYALGIIGYELLTGFHPYQRHGAPTARKMGLKPPQLKGLKLREAKALERCLSLDRKNRPKDAGEFLKMFRGITTLQKVTLAATAVLAIISAYLWYQNYLETSPAIPFAQLPAETQQQFRDAMSEGDKAWTIYKAEKFPGAVDDSVQFYARAYNLHPRNRDAVAALKRAADEFLKLHDGTPEERHEAAGFLQGQTDYFLKYAPVVEAAK